MASVAPTSIRKAFEESGPTIRVACEQLLSWLRERYYHGYEPDDLRESLSFQRPFFRNRPIAKLVDYFSEHSGARVRRWLRVPPSYTPTTLAFTLAACSEIYPFDPSVLPTLLVLRGELLRLRNPNEREFCWGDHYDERFDKNVNAPVFQPDSLVTYLCGSAMLALVEKVHDSSALPVAESVGRYFITRLNRSVDEADELCFSASPDDQERIYHKSALVGSYLARLWALNRNDEYLELAQRCMRFLRNGQLPTGMWYCGLGENQREINAIQTSYNVIALNDYRRATGDHSVDDTILSGNEAFKRVFFESDGKPKMHVHRLYPVDIRACSQAIEHFAAMMHDDPDAPQWATGVMKWTMHHMRNADGSFAYRKYATGKQRMAFAGWGQAHTLYALAKMRAALAQ